MSILEGPRGKASSRDKKDQGRRNVCEHLIEQQKRRSPAQISTRLTGNVLWQYNGNHTAKEGTRAEENRAPHKTVTVRRTSAVAKLWEDMESVMVAA
jgi:hypothetical protein